MFFYSFCLSYLTGNVRVGLADVLAVLSAEDIRRPEKQIHAHVFPTPQTNRVTGACEGLWENLDRQMKIVQMNVCISRQLICRIYSFR